MKNYLTLVLALSVVSAPAFASRARLESLGEGKNGSFYIDDSRDFFLDPAQLVHYKKKLFLELGGDTVGAQDSAGAGSRAQGGFTNTFGDFTYALYMNQTSEKTLQILNVANGITGAGTFLAPDSTIEAFLAGEGAIGWGISVFYAGNDSRGATGAEKTASQLGARVGVDAGALSVFTAVGIVTKSTNQDDATNPSQLKGKVGLDGGIEYKMDNQTTYGKFTITGADVMASGSTTANNEIRFGQYGIGTGWKKEMTKSTNMFARVEVDYSKVTVGNIGGVNAALTTWNLPLVLAAETQALSWLTIRGSIQESLWGQRFGNNPTTFTANYRDSLQGTTTVAAGLGLTFGDIVIDGLVASGTGASNPANGIAGFGTGPQAASNFGFGDNMLTRLAMTYNF